MPAALIVAGLALSLLASSPATAAQSEFYGVTQPANVDDQDIQGMASAGVHIDRFPLIWHAVEPSRDSFNWAQTDGLIGRLASHGIRSLPILWGSPDWAGTGGTQRPPVSASARQAWRRFLSAAVTRYGPDGTYWATGYQQRFGPNATPLPITSWQIWNEPNLKYFLPGGTLKRRVQRYAELMQISDQAIKARDPRARVVLGGMAGYSYSDPPTHGWDFLDRLYQVPGFKNSFDAAALHPYGFSLDMVRQAIAKFRAVMKAHGDSAKPLWLTEFGWASEEPDGPPTVRRGWTGQAQMLRRTFKVFLQERDAWNLQRLFWYLWRDPPPDDPDAQACGFCASDGLWTYDGIEKPAYSAFLHFAADATPPEATIVAAPAEGSATADPTPTLEFASSEAGSSFGCSFDAKPLVGCSSPLTPKAKLPDGPHSFSVEAIDSAGNQSALVSRSFTVNAHAPPPPRIAVVVPKSPANNNTPRLSGSAEALSTIRLYERAGCAGPPTRQGSAATFASPGFAVFVPDNSITRFRATATDAAGNTSPCSAARTFVEDSIAPQTTITGGPSGPTTESAPTFTFASNEAQSTFRCRFDQQPFAACSGPGQNDTPSAPLTSGPHSFSVQATDRAQNTDYTAAKRTFTVTP